MDPLPLPSRVHYELLLQLLERQTLPAIEGNTLMRDRARDLTITLRKALAQQKQLEAACEQNQRAIDYRWSLNTDDTTRVPRVTPSDPRPRE